MGVGQNDSQHGGTERNIKQLSFLGLGPRKLPCEELVRFDHQSLRDCRDKEANTERTKERKKEREREREREEEIYSQ